MRSQDGFLRLMPLRADLRCMVRLCERAGGVDVDRHALFRSLAELIVAAGVCIDSERARALEQIADSEMHPSELARRFRRLARASDPLAPMICPPELRWRLDALARERWQGRRAAARGIRRTSLSGVAWRQLNPAEQRDIRGMARDLARVASRHARKGRSPDPVKETLLLGLSDIFAASTGSLHEREMLPHAANSDFILFCSIAMGAVYRLAPTLPADQGRHVQRLIVEERRLPSRLAQHWKRLKTIMATEYEVDLSPKVSVKADT